MITILVSCLLLVLAALPALMVVRNLPLFQLAHDASSEMEPARVSVLIPARNEQAGIGQAIESVLSNRHVDWELVVMDDHSTDATSQIVAERAAADARIRLEHAPPLPEGWNGKQHACWHLAQAARFEWLLFLDADVRLGDSAIVRILAEQRHAGCELLSGFPRQITVSLAERLLIPLMYYVLLGFLPLDQMRASRKAEFGAGCGQLFLVRREDYMAAGGHASIRASRHDGLQLPRSFRRAGMRTDLFDASDIASVRMYHDWSSVLHGLQKNATEGIANAKLIVLFTGLLLGAAVLPILSLAHALYHGWNWPAISLLLVASLLSFLPRILIARRLESSWLGAALHPLSVAIFVAIQWMAFARQAIGGPVSWRGRPA